MFYPAFRLTGFTTPAIQGPTCRQVTGTGREDTRVARVYEASKMFLLKQRTLYMLSKKKCGSSQSSFATPIIVELFWR